MDTIVFTTKKERDEYEKNILSPFQYDVGHDLMQQ